MKALTIWQPWASLIALGVKPYEFRSWSAHKSIVGQRIAIHAGARKPKVLEVHSMLLQLKSDDAWKSGLSMDLDKAIPYLEAVLDGSAYMPTGVVVCTAILGAPISAAQIVHEFGGPVYDGDSDDQTNFAWPLTDIKQVMPPVEVKGMQGFWNFEGVKSCPSN